MSWFFERFRIGIIILVTSLTAFYGCKREKSAEQIYNEQASGVVMILNQYYYSVTLPTGDTFYFSDIQDGKIVNPAFSASNVQTTFSFGTGFFIDNNGTIMTNRHVVNHYIKKSDVVQYVKNLTGALVSYAQERQEEIAYQAGRIYQILNYGSQSPEYNAALKQRLHLGSVRKLEDHSLAWITTTPRDTLPPLGEWTPPTYSLSVTTNSV